MWEQREPKESIALSFLDHWQCRDYWKVFCGLFGLDYVEDPPEFCEQNLSLLARKVEDPEYRAIFCKSFVSKVRAAQQPEFCATLRALYTAAAARQDAKTLADLGGFLRRLLLHRDAEFTLKMLQDHPAELFDCLDHEQAARAGRSSSTGRYLAFVTDEAAVLARRYPETQTIAEAATRRHRATFLFEYVFALDVPEDFALFAGSVGSAQQMLARFNAQLVDALVASLEPLERFLFTDREEALPHVAQFLSELMDLLKSVPGDKKSAVYRAFAQPRFKTCCQLYLRHHLQKPLGRTHPRFREHCRLVLGFLELLGATEKAKSKADQPLFRDANPTEMIDLIVQFEEHSTFPYIR